jgi:hypothetical protein
MGEWEDTEELDMEEVNVALQAGKKWRGREKERERERER